MPSDPVTVCLYSIGHSNHDLTAFLGLLQRAGVTAVADVRSHPFSQWQPQYNRRELERSLPAAGIAYLFLGEELGGRPDDPALYDADGQVDYERVRATPLFREGIRRLLEALKRYSVATLCSEEDPLDCHRALMVGPALKQYGVAMAHLRGNGTIESLQEMEDRLLATTGVGDGLLDGLFADQFTASERRDLLIEAYRVQASARAFRRG